eukprot:TRINITY_DN11002_c0_g1_i1.p4 TRINITY_DN11002_c0_g1~~TRINITY_DN11002_c0_g1_i1.p4  ORF type:complete len:200 (+),score=59.28 TRINITY_DN11002_c0_g1_i1:86-685(+)
MAGSFLQGVQLHAALAQAAASGPLGGDPAYVCDYFECALATAAARPGPEGRSVLARLLPLAEGKRDALAAALAAAAGAQEAASAGELLWAGARPPPGLAAAAARHRGDLAAPPQPPAGPGPPPTAAERRAEAAGRWLAGYAGACCAARGFLQWQSRLRDACTADGGPAAVLLPPELRHAALAYTLPDGAPPPRPRGLPL